MPQSKREGFKLGHYLRDLVTQPSSRNSVTATRPRSAGNWCVRLYDVFLRKHLPFPISKGRVAQLAEQLTLNQ